MKKVLIVLLACIASVVFAQESETRNLESFTGVKVSEGISVYLKKGDKETARVEVTGTKASNVITEISGSYLKVHMRDGNYRNANAKVYVTYVSLDKLYASSAGNIYSSETIKGNDMEINASSAGTIEVVVEAGRLEASASSAGDVEIKGKARNVIVDASSAGEVDAYDLEADDAEIEASSAGAVKISVKSGLDARASSGGSIRYRGNPDKSNTTSSSGGSVKKSN
ncbi:MAG TPA: head GIN domain-containing protein [Chryseosolibacter sp.]